MKFWHLVLAASLLSTTAFGQSAPVPTKTSTGFLSLTTNPGGYTFVNSALGMQILGLDQGRDGINAACKFAPLAPYSVIAHFSINTAVGVSNESGGGLAWYDPSSGGFIAEYLFLYPSAASSGASVYSTDFNVAFTTVGSEGTAAYAINNAGPQVWVKLVDNGSQIQAFYSYDGVGWTALFGSIRYVNTFFTKRPPKVCVFANGHMAPINILVDYYQETSP